MGELGSRRDSWPRGPHGHRKVTVTWSRTTWPSRSWSISICIRSIQPGAAPGEEVGEARSESALLRSVPPSQADSSSQAACSVSLALTHQAPPYLVEQQLILKLLHVGNLLA